MAIVPSRILSKPCWTPNRMSLKPATPLDLVDLVDVDDATLSSVHVTFGSQDQPGQQALNVIADVPSFRQTRGISDNQRDVQIGSQGLDQMGLPEPGDRSGGCWTSPSTHSEIGVGDDRIGSVTIPAIDETLEMVAHAQGEPSLGNVLPNHELVEVGDQGLG